MRTISAGMAVAMSILGLVSGGMSGHAAYGAAGSGQQVVVCEFRVINSAGVFRQPVDIYTKPPLRVLLRGDVVWADPRRFPHPTEKNITVREIPGSGWVIAGFLARTPEPCRPL